MVVKLITDELSTDNRTFRLQMIQNFKIIETNLNQILGELPDGNTVTLNAQNIETLILILAKYGVPLQMVNGKVMEEEE